MPSDRSTKKRVTLGIIGEKLDNIHEDITGMKKSIKHNSEFRIKSEAQAGVLKYALGSGWGLAILVFILSIAGVI